MDEFKRIGAKDVNIDELIKKFSDVDKSVVKVARNVKGGEIDISELDMAMANAATTGSKFSASLKSMAANIGISLGISLAIQGISYLIQYQEQLRQKTEEAANAYKETSSSVEGYVSRYQELHQALLNAKGNEEETYNIKKQLLDLQTEINDTFGDEYGKINLVTDAYKDQTDAIKAYNKEAADTFLNEHWKGIDKAEKAMTQKRRYNLGGVYDVESDEAFEEAKKVAEKYHGKGIEIIRDDYDGSLSFQLTADVQSAETVINEFMTDFILYKNINCRKKYKVLKKNLKAPYRQHL